MARLSRKRECEIMNRTNFAKISVALGFDHDPTIFIPAKPTRKKRVVIQDKRKKS